MQVLPIGLGVVAGEYGVPWSWLVGLVVITLIVVGYVMYERRKYKWQYINRKLAEGMKYGSAWCMYLDNLPNCGTIHDGMPSGQELLTAESMQRD
jgi:hypothetical protein